MIQLAIAYVLHVQKVPSFVKADDADSWKDNRRFRCIVVRSIDLDMVVSQYNNNYLIGATKPEVKHEWRTAVVNGNARNSLFHPALRVRLEVWSNEGK